MSRRDLLVLMLALSIVGQMPAGAFQARGSRQAGRPDTAPASVAVIESSEQGITLEFTAPDFQLTAQALEGETAGRVEIGGADRTAEPGKPDLPVVSALLGVPPEAQLDLQIVDDPSEVLSGRYDLPPVPGPQPLLEDLQAGQLVYTRDAAVYQSADLYPAAPARIAEEAWLRDQRLVRVEFAPFQYSPRQGRLVRHAHITARLLFSSGRRAGSEAITRVPPGDNSPFEAELQSSLLNYAEARRWRARVAPAVETLAAAASGPLFRITISQDGLYRISYETLTAAGWPGDKLDATRFQLTNQGQEAALLVTNLDGNPNRFSAGEAILFYGQKFTGERMAQRYAADDDQWLSFARQLPDGSYTAWKPQLNAAMFEKYTDDNVYWLSYGATAGKRMASVNGAPGSAPLSPSYRATVHAEQQKLWKTTLFTSEETFFWERLQTSKIMTRTYTATLTAPVSGVISATLRGEAVGGSNNVLSTPDHHIQVRLNPGLYPAVVRDAAWDGISRYRFEGQLPQTALVDGTNQLFFTVITPTAISDDIWFDWFEVEYNRLYQAASDALAFTTPQAGGWKYALGGFTAPQVMLLDVTQPLTPTQVVGYTYTGGVVTFEANAPGGEAYFAGQPTDLAPAQVVASHLPDLLSPSNAADYVIITHHDFITEAQTLADYRQGQGFQPRVVDVADLYDLFNDGIYHPIAIKNFLAYAVGHWQTPPVYAILVGDGTWNFKAYSEFPRPKITMPPYLAWVDPWQGEIDSANLLATVVGNDPLADVLIGRMPVNTPAELGNIISKIAAYEAQPPQLWQLRSLFVTDNTPDPAGNFVQMAENIISAYATPGFSYDRIYEDDYGCQSGGFCLNVNRAITQTLNVTGTLLLNFIGHGHVNRWTSEQIFVNYYIDLHKTPPEYYSDSISALLNGDKLPIVLSMTCLDGYWYYPYYSSLMEDMLRAAGKGSVGSFSPTGLGIATGHDWLHSGFYQALFRDGVWELGQAALGARLKLFESGQNYDLLHTFTVFGDPALRIASPYDLAARPATQARDGYKSFSVEYTLTVTNTGTLTDTFTAELVSSQWPVTLPTSAALVAPGGRANFSVWVTVPADSLVGASDQARVAITSQGNRARRILATLTTRAGSRLALPLVRR